MLGRLVIIDVGGKDGNPLFFGSEQLGIGATEHPPLC
jgi:hypothetical protein